MVWQMYFKIIIVWDLNHNLHISKCIKVVCFKFSCYAFDPGFHCWLDLENISEQLCILNYMDTALILETVKLAYKQNCILFIEHSLLDICANNIKAQNKLYKLYKIFWLLFPFQIKIAIEPGAFHYNNIDGKHCMWLFTYSKYCMEKFPILR